MVEKIFNNPLVLGLIGLILVVVVVGLLIQTNIIPDNPLQPNCVAHIVEANGETLIDNKSDVFLVHVAYEGGVFDGDSFRGTERIGQIRTLALTNPNTVFPFGSGDYFNSGRFHDAVFWVTEQGENRFADGRGISNEFNAPIPSRKDFVYLNNGLERKIIVYPTEDGRIFCSASINSSGQLEAFQGF